MKTQKEFQKLLEELKKLNLPNDRYAIYGSGPLAIRGLKEIYDLDVIVTDELYQELTKKYPEKEKGKIVIGDIEIFPLWNFLLSNPQEVLERAETIQGFRFIRLEDLINWKKKMARKKDFEDIKLIEEYLRKPESLC